MTSILSLEPSQLCIVLALTQYFVLPAINVEGVGLVLEAVPPEAEVYHNKVSVG